MELESALRDNLNEAVMSALDAANLNHERRAARHGNGLTARTGDAAAVATFADHYAFLFDSATIDGEYACYVQRRVKILYGPARLQAMPPASTGATAVDMTALSAIMRDSGGVMTSAHVPDAGSNDQNVVVRKGMRRDFTCAAVAWALKSSMTTSPARLTGELVIWTAYLMAANSEAVEGRWLRKRRMVQVA